MRIEDGKAEITFKPLVDGAEIYYTLDGTNPLQYGKLYRQKLSVPLTLQGIQVKYVVVLPSGRYSCSLFCEMMITVYIFGCGKSTSCVNTLA